MSVPPQHPSRSRAGERVWEAACDLFYREGIRSVGVAEIAARSGVGKPNLYRNFTSKDGLAVAYITAKAEAERALFEQAMTEYPGEPMAQLRWVIAAVADVICAPGYRGCPMANAAVEFPDRNHPVLAAVEASKAARLARLAELTAGMEVVDPHKLAYMIQLLLEGAAASAQVLPPDRSAAAMVEAVDRLISSCRADSDSDSDTDTDNATPPTPPIPSRLTNPTLPKE